MRYRVSSDAADGHDALVTSHEPADAWSPADNPYAIAVSEGQWWLRSAQLCAQRIQGKRDPGHQSVQIDARLFIICLRQLLYAAEMEQAAIVELPVEPRRALGLARREFEQAVPSVVAARDRLVHFGEYATGTSIPQRREKKAGTDPRTLASRDWGFGYDHGTGVIGIGPHQVDVLQATAEAEKLFWAIYMAATAVDDAREKDHPSADLEERRNMQRVFKAASSTPPEGDGHN
jgi:hypothetical protein